MPLGHTGYGRINVTPLWTQSHLQYYPQMQDCAECSPTCEETGTWNRYCYYRDGRATTVTTALCIHAKLDGTATFFVPRHSGSFPPDLAPSSPSLAHISTYPTIACLRCLFAPHRNSLRFSSATSRQHDRDKPIGAAETAESSPLRHWRCLRKYLYFPRTIIARGDCTDASNIHSGEQRT